MYISICSVVRVRTLSDVRSTLQQKIGVSIKCRRGFGKCMSFKVPCGQCVLCFAGSDASVIVRRGPGLPVRSTPPTKRTVQFLRDLSCCNTLTIP
jgi:hypothetical protein